MKTVPMRLMLSTSLGRRIHKSIHNRGQARLGSTQFSHMNGMVDVGSKQVTDRAAIASCLVTLPERVIDVVFSKDRSINQKGEPVYTAILAGVMAAKRTSELIPLCHQIPLSQVNVDITRHGSDSLKIVGFAKASNRTGVEMEALTAVSVSALTIYDMTKSAIKGTGESIVISEIRLDSKQGGTSS